MYSRAQLEQDLAALEQQRHIVRVSLLVSEQASRAGATNESIGAMLSLSPEEVAVYRNFPLSGPFEAKQLLNSLDREEQRLNGRLVGTRLALQDRENMKRKYSAVFVVCSRKNWVRQMQGRWIVTNLKELASLSQAGNLIILLVPFAQLDWYKQRYEQFGWKVQAKAPRRAETPEDAQGDQTPQQQEEAMPEIVTESKRTYQVVPVEVARELVRREQATLAEAVSKLPAKGKVTQEEYNAAIRALPQVREILWGFDGDMSRAGIVVWEADQA